MARTRPEDRGNAILSTLPLHDYAGIELPLERQRRVALAATVNAQINGQESLSVCAWCQRTYRTSSGTISPDLLGAGPRPSGSRPGEGPDQAAKRVVGGDFNTWFGSWDQAYCANFPAR